MPNNPEHSASTLNLKTRLIVFASIAIVGVASLAFFYSQGLINLYGDSLAHLEGARRILDSRTPGYAEIGTVWLPVPHLLMSLPAQNHFLWRTGLAGGMVSTLAFMLACWIVFKLSHGMNGNLMAAVAALAGFMLSPNMLYLASTPLTEPLALLFILLMAYQLFRFRETGRTGALIAASIAGFLGTLSRYECWSILPFAAGYVLWARGGPWYERARRGVIFAFISGSGPLLWVLHNAYRFHNPLEFYNGPFSAKGIYAHQLATTGFQLPTAGSYLVSLRYYLEDLKLVIGFWPLALMLLGIIAWASSDSRRKERAAALLLLLPFPFHVQALTTAALPLYVPTLFPNTYWNLRLGIEMLPAAALFPAFLIPSGGSPKLRRGVLAFLLATIALQYTWMARSGPADLAVAKEGVLNNPCLGKRQQLLTHFMRANYDRGNILLAAGKWPCALPDLGLPYRNTVSDANPEDWKLVAIHPDRMVEWIVRGDDEPVDWLMSAHAEAFERFEVVLDQIVPSEGRLRVYRKKQL